MNLVTEHCIIRNFTTNDADELYETLSNEEVMEYIEPVFDMKRTKEFIETAGLCVPPLVYALIWKDTGKVIGHVIFHQYENDSYEIGWVLNRKYWGKGIAGEVTTSLIDYSKSLEAKSCVIECAPGQKVSQHIAQKNHFVFEGEQDGCAVYRMTF